MIDRELRDNGDLVLYAEVINLGAVSLMGDPAVESLRSETVRALKHD